MPPRPRPLGGAGDGRDHIVYHAYDKTDHGAPTLRISPIRWDGQGWPIAVE